MERFRKQLNLKNDKRMLHRIYETDNILVLLIVVLISWLKLPLIFYRLGLLQLVSPFHNLPRAAALSFQPSRTFLLRQDTINKIAVRLSYLSFRFSVKTRQKIYFNECYTLLCDLVYGPPKQWAEYCSLQKKRHNFFYFKPLRVNCSHNVVNSATAE